jgi:DNA mismatch repair protein MutL
VHDSYIVAESENGFVIIDQHALHERIIYEELCRRVSTGSLESQRLLIPDTFEITAAQMHALEENAELLKKLGIKVESFGPRTAAVQSFPVMLSGISPRELVHELLDLLTDKNQKLDPERLLHEVLDMAACKGAIKAGQKLTEKEIEELIANKDIVERASRCPHGRPTTIAFSIAELEKQFKRT